MIIKHDRIAIVSTVINFKLYDQTSRCFPRGFQKFVIDGRNGMHGIDSLRFIFKKFKKFDFEYLVLCDEDVIFSDPSVVLDIIEKMKIKSYTVAGVRDGGVISHRGFNPLLVNTFFSIINFKNVSEYYNERTMLKQQYLSDKEQTALLPDLPFKYDLSSLYEPYYCFFLNILRNNGTILYLDGKMADDNIANEIYWNDEKFALHTWYARSYLKNDKHTQRIDRFLNFTEDLRVKSSHYVLMKDHGFFIKRNFRKLINKVVNFKFSS